MSALTMLKISENNGREEIGLVTPTPGSVVIRYSDKYTIPLNEMY